MIAADTRQSADRPSLAGRMRHLWSRAASWSLGGGLGGYDAVKTSARRRPPPITTTSEDRLLNQSDRRKLVAGVRQLRRNFSIAAWMIRRHVDFVASFRFQPKTGDEAVDKQLERLVRRDSKPDKAHSRGRCGLPGLIRLAETLRVVDGDCGWVRLGSGHVQLIEGDRIRDPMGVTRTGWFNGVRVNDMGRPLEYAIHRRMDGGASLQFERFLSARNMILHGYFDREDQCRGVSPLASAYNELQDVYEFHDYTRVRAKIQSLFGLVFKRDSELGLGTLTTEASEDGEDKPRYSVDPGKGPFKLELEPGDEAAFLESQHPTTQLQQYAESVLVLALKSLDLPFSFLREDFTNFFGSRGAWLLYERACEPKREDNQALLDDWTQWKAAGWILSGELVLPQGVTLDDQPWEWIPRKVPAFKRLEDIKADLLALGAGLSTPDAICREDDEGNWRDNINDIAAAIQHAEEKGVGLSWATAASGGDDETDIQPTSQKGEESDE